MIGKVVEAHETYVGGKETNKRLSKRQAGMLARAGKEPVFSIVERKGRVRSQHVPTVTGRTLRTILRDQVHEGTRLMTDRAPMYRSVDGDFVRESVNHSIDEYVRGDVHTNTIEGYFSILKRGIVGTYHYVSQQHLKRYLGEFDFRYNERIALGVDDASRTVKAMAGSVGKRVTYQDTNRAAGQDAGARVPPVAARPNHVSFLSISKMATKNWNSSPR